MISNVYAKAYTEVIEIISHFSEEEYSKIPAEKIEFYKANMDKDYKFVIDPEIDLEEQNISREANAIIIMLFRDYFATEEQKIKLKEILELNQKKAEYKKREKYNPDNIFKDVKKEDTEKDNTEKDNTEKDNTNNQMQLIEYKESFFGKLKKFIFKILHIKS